MNQPDVWIVNRADMTARHVKDTDPKGVSRIPVAAIPELPDLTKELEIGREVEYFKEQKAKEMRL